MRLVTLSAFGILALAGCSPSLPMPGGDPASPSAAIPTKPYRSVFMDDARFDLVEPRSWRETNERVRVFGGPNIQMQSDSEEDDQLDSGAAHGHKH
jgi:hypothetical protein